MPTSNDLLRLLARAGDLLGSTLDPGEVLWSLSRLVVPSLADWSMVTLIGPDGAPSDVEAWHVDPAKREATRAFAAHRFSGRTSQRGSMSTLATGEPFVLESGAKEYARSTLQSPEALEWLEQLGLESVVVVPMAGPTGVMGMITLCRGPERAAMTPAELETSIDIARRASITFGRARSYERQRTSSEQLQRSLLTEPPVLDQFEVVTRYVPAAEEAQIGGDWYDAFVQPAGSTVLVVGDVAGHDFAAAAMMGQLRSMLRGIGVTNGSGPARLLEDLDGAIETLGLDASATAAVVRLTPDGSSFTYSNAGHPGPVLLGADGVVVELDDHDTMLGVVPDERRRQVGLDLDPGATLVLFTDGLVERRGEDIDLGNARLHRVLADGHGDALGPLVDRVISELVPQGHDDDVAVLAVRRR